MKTWGTTMIARIVTALLCSVVLTFSIVHSQAQAAASARTSGEDDKRLDLTFRGDSALLSKYIWRGQRLTNDWSWQPSLTAASGPISFNIWGTLDVTAVNEAPGLLLASNPEPRAGGQDSGLRGKFSEIDYTLNYSREAGKGTVNAGTIIYTFPERSAVLPSTTELYAGYTFSSVPFSPAVTLFVDVDETGDRGETGLYIRLTAAHSFPVSHNVFSGLDLSTSLGIASSGFGAYYYGSDSAGLHDFNLTLAVPMKISEHWSASGCVAYSALLGDFRGKQYPDLREVYRGRTGPGKADTVWGGMTLSLVF